MPGENKAGLSGQSISRLPLETCQTMNGMWGYKIKDQDYKSPCELVRLLVRTAGKGANLLLNIGPQPDGQLPAAALERLEAMGQWLGKYGASIYGTQEGGYGDGETIVSTRRGNTLYLHCLSNEPQSFDVALNGVPDMLYTLDSDDTFKWDWRDGKLHVDVSPRSDAWDTIIVVEGVKIF